MLVKGDTDLVKYRSREKWLSDHSKIRQAPRQHRCRAPVEFQDTVILTPSIAINQRTYQIS